MEHRQSDRLKNKNRMVTQVSQWLQGKLIIIGLLLWVVGMMLYGAMNKPSAQHASNLLVAGHVAEDRAYQQTLRANLAKIRHGRQPPQPAPAPLKSHKDQLQRQSAPLLMWKNEREVARNVDDLPLSVHKANRQSPMLVMGEVIPAVLETALDITQAGMARAMVSLPVYSYENRKVLIPAGSRLVGRYTAISSPAQRRVAILWHQLILPDGRHIHMQNLSIDPLGESGHLAQWDRNNWLQSWQQIALWSLLVKNVSLPASALQKHWQPRHHLHVPQGTPIAVIVGRDIRFR